MTTQLNIEQVMQIAVQHHQAGRLAQAESLYMQVLAAQPNHAGALNLLGVLAGQAGRNDLALGLLKQAVQFNPNYAEAHNNLGNFLRNAGQHEVAIAAFTRAVELKPDYAEALNNLAVALRNVGRFDDAIAALGHALRVRPNSADVYHNLGLTLVDHSRSREAVAAFRAAIGLKPDHAPTWINLASALVGLGEMDQAIPAFMSAISLQPRRPELFYNLANALKDCGRLDDAATAYRHAITLKPDFAEAHNNLGTMLKDRGDLEGAITEYQAVVQLQPGASELLNVLGGMLSQRGRQEEAIAAFLRATEISPNFVSALYNLGTELSAADRPAEAIPALKRALELEPENAWALLNLSNAQREKKDFEAAIESTRQAIDLIPDFAEAHWNLSLMLLLTGKFPEGWAEYEWRWKVESMPRPREFSQPQWQGEPLNKRRILLHAEQGFGDTIQYVRFAKLLAGRGARVVFECQPELSHLLSRTPGVGRAVPAGQPLPDFDLQCPLMSLPLALKTELKSIPASLPYVLADPDVVEAWKARFKGRPNRLRVGIVWVGRREHPRLRNRAIPLEQWTEIAAVDGVDFISLQFGPSANDSPPQGMELTNWSEDLDDFSETAALVHHLDLVITVDTAVAHLAGAMGKPTWIMLPFVPDWRWLLARADSPWYPTAKLFRQKTPGNWDEVLHRVAQELRRCVESTRA